MYKLDGAFDGSALAVIARNGIATIGSAEALFQGAFERVDQHLLITGPSGERFLVRGYFAASETPVLTSPDGAIMVPDTVRALAGEMLGDMLAQAGAPAAAGTIGRVEQLGGAASVQRGGSSLRLQVGDPVYKGDVVSTQGPGSTLGIKFVDGTVFSLSANARMVLNELVYNPGGSNNSMAANLIQGTFVFVAGQTAHTGDMKITTPVATMGIRGTTPVVNINAANGQTTFALLPDPDSNRIGTYDLLEVLTGRLIRSVSETGRAVVLASVGGTPLDRPYTTAEVVTSQTLQNQITSLYRASTQSPTIDPQQQQPGDRGQLYPLNPLVGNIDVALTDADRQAIDLAALDKTPKPPSAVAFKGVESEEAKEPSEFVAIGLTVPDPIVRDATGGPLLLSPLNGGSVSENSQIVFFDLAQGQIGLTISQVQITSSNGATVTAFLIGNLLAIDPIQFKYLNNGQSLTLTLTYTASNGTSSASTVGQLVVTGVNDAPNATSDIFFGTAPGDDPGVNAIGNVLANDFDIDSIGPFTIASVNGIVPNSPIVVHGVRGTLTVESTTGGFVFVPNSGPENRALSARDVGTEDFYYVVQDPEGGRTTGVLTIALQGQNDMPIGVDDNVSSTAAGIGSAIAASGNVLANDIEYDNGDIILVTAVDTTPMPPGGVTPITITGYYAITDFYADGTFVSTPRNIWDLSILAVGQFVTESYYYYFADGNGGIAVAYLNVTIDGANDAPTAAADTVNVTEAGVPGPGNDDSGNVLTNDSDIDTGDTLSVTHLNGLAFTSAASASNAYGNFQVDSAGNWTFTVDNLSATVQSLAQGSSASFSHTVTVADNHGASVNALVNVTVNGQNDAPTAVDDVDTATEDTLKTVLRTLMFANDIDPDNGDTKSLYSLTAILGGSIAFSGGGANFNPDAHFSGQGQFGYTMWDAAGVTSYAVVTVDVAPVADAPTIQFADLTPVANGGEVQVNTYTTAVQSNASVAALANGNTVVVWQSSGQDGSNYGIYGQRFTANGTALGSEFQINTTTANEQEAAAIAALADGGFVVTWMDSAADGSAYGIFGQRFNALGNAVGSEFQINSTGTGNQQHVSIAALDTGGFIAVWESGHAGSWDIYGQKFDSDGFTVGSQLLVNGVSGGAEVSAHVAGLASGGFVVTWTSDNLGSGTNDISARIFDDNLSPIANNFDVNSLQTGDQNQSSVARLQNGNFIVVWQSDAAGSFDIFGRIFASNGTGVGSQFAVNSTIASDQQWPSVIGLNDGGFLVSWTSQGQDGSGLGVYAQRFNSSGSAVGGEFVVNQSTAGDQYNNFPQGWQIAQQSDGKFVFVWEGEPFVNQAEVYKRDFSTPGTGPEDTAINLGTMQITTPDNDGSETIVVVLTGQPLGATFNKGYVDPGNAARWIIDGGDVNALSTNPLVMTPPANWNGTFNLTVTAEVTDTATLTTGTVTDTETGSASMTVVVTPANDAPVANGETVIGYNSNIGTSIHIPYSAIQFNDTDIDDSNVVFLHSVSSTWGAASFGTGGVDFTQSPLITGPETVDYDVSDAHGAVSATASMTFQDSDDLSTMSGTSGDDILISELAFAEEMTGGAGRDVFVFQNDTVNRATATDYLEGQDAIWVPVDAGAIGSGSLSDFVFVLDGYLYVDFDGIGGAGSQWIGTIDGLTAGGNDVITVLLDDVSSSFRGEITAQFIGL